MKESNSVCMIADYIDNGIDCHNAYIVTGAPIYEQAVRAVVGKLEHGGATVQCVTVIPGTYSLDRLMEMAEAPLPPGMVALQYLIEPAKGCEWRS